MHCADRTFVVAVIVAAGCGALGPPPGAPRVCGGAPCEAGQNCLDQTCRPAAADCTEIRAMAPSASDGVYMLKLGGKVEPAYCDMRTGGVLCAATVGTHAGTTRDREAPDGLPFFMTSVLEDGGWCRIWAVRHEMGQPIGGLLHLDRPDALVKSTCESLGLQGGDDQIPAENTYCLFGSDSGYSDCGFGQRGERSKWANTCDCNANWGKPFYSLEHPIYVGTLPWTMDGSVYSRCRVTPGP
jgi:hypothetical protein